MPFIRSLCTPSQVIDLPYRFLLPVANMRWQNPPLGIIVWHNNNTHLVYLIPSSFLMYQIHSSNRLYIQESSTSTMPLEAQ